MPESRGLVSRSGGEEVSLETEGHGENGALALSSDYTVRIPELTPADATVRIDLDALVQGVHEINAKLQSLAQVRLFLGNIVGFETP